jgi:hypothetical protein
VATAPRKPRASRRTAFTVPPKTSDPIDAVLGEDEDRMADDLSDTMQELSGLSGSDVKVHVFRITKKGPWEHCKTLEPPVNTDGLIEELKEDYGAGEYVMRTYAAGRGIVSNKRFAIAAPKSAAVRPSFMAGRGEEDWMMRLLLEGRDRGGNDMMPMVTMMMKSQEQAAQSFRDMMGLLIPAMMAGKVSAESPTDQLLKAMALTKELQGPQANMKDMLETFSMFKALTDGGEGGGGLMGMAEKALPLLANFAEAAQRNSAGATPPPQLGQPPSQALPAPRSEPPPVTGAGSAPAPANDAPAAATHPLIDLVREDVIYFMNRGHNPELAAEAVADVLENAGKGEEEVRGLGLEIFAAGEAWPDALAAYGLDVRTGPLHKEWFMEFVSALAAQYEGGDAEPDQHADDQQGPPGGGADAGHHARTGGRGKPRPDGAQQGGEADIRAAS